MSPAVLAVILGFLGACVTALVTWKIGRRPTSGSVDTSEAASLWTESSKIRGELREEIVGLRAELTRATASIAELLIKIAASDDATSTARAETAMSRGETAELRVEIEQISKKLADLHSEVVTGNAQTAGMLLDNNESRRIAEIPVAERTATERGHIEKVGIRGEDGDHEGQDNLDESERTHD